MACRLTGAKPSSEPMLEYCWLDPKEILIKIHAFLFTKCVWKCLSLNVLTRGRFHWKSPRYQQPYSKTYSALLHDLTLNNGWWFITIRICCKITYLSLIPFLTGESELIYCGKIMQQGYWSNLYQVRVGSRKPQSITWTNIDLLSTTSWDRWYICQYSFVINNTILFVVYASNIKLDFRHIRKVHRCFRQHFSFNLYWRKPNSHLLCEKGIDLWWNSLGTYHR